jgi:hypothetical protein
MQTIEVTVIKNCDLSSNRNGCLVETRLLVKIKRIRCDMCTLLFYKQKH